MFKFHCITTLVCLTLLATSSTMNAEKIKVATAADLPRVNFELNAKPSEILQMRGELLDALIQSVEADANKVLAEYEIGDKSTQASLLNALYAAAFLQKDWERVLELGIQGRALETKETNRYTSNTSTDAYAKAALETGEEGTEAFRKSLEKHYKATLEAMPFEVVQDGLQAASSQFEIVTLDLIKGQVAASFDPNAEAQDLVVDRGFASAILNVVKTIDLVPHMDILGSSLKNYLAANEVEKVDLWSKRQVDLSDLDGLTPVVTTVWDSGTDIALFPDQRWINESEQPNGIDDDNNGFADDLSGLAFGVDNKPTTGSLMQLPEGDYEDLDASLGLIAGAMDLQANLNTEEASKFKKLITSLSAEAVQPFMLRMGRIGLYAHGTLTAYTTVENNPAARLMYVRFTMDIKPVMDPFDEAYADSFVEYVNTVFEYLKKAQVRVVNMSWRITTPMIEASLAQLEPDSEKRRERSLKIFERMSSAMEQGIQSAPETLFIAGAGNEDEDVDFVKSIPAGLSLPNLITVGAVDISLQPAIFTSFGKSIDLYANGFEVNSRMPGGKKTIINGTSLAAPQVANLASKLLAVEPSLSVSEVRNLIEETSTIEGDEQIKVIHPKAAFDALENR